VFFWLFLLDSNGLDKIEGLEVIIEFWSMLFIEDAYICERHTEDLELTAEAKETSDPGILPWAVPEKAKKNKIMGN